MSSFLHTAEGLDNYQNLCKRDIVNGKARSACSYTAWHDQTAATATATATASKDVQIVIMNPSAEGGMPHTRPPNIICIPAYFPESMMAETMKHELIHLSQRNQPAEWEKYGLSEGWMKMTNLEHPEHQEHPDIPSEWLRRCRLNPDTIHSRFWAWEGRYIPLPLFVREDKPDLKDIVVRWYDLQTEVVSSSPPKSFIKKYGNVPANSQEHPFELWAYSGINPIN